MGPRFGSRMTLRSKASGVKLTRDMTMGEVFTNTHEMPTLLYTMQSY